MLILSPSRRRPALRRAIAFRRFTPNPHFLGRRLRKQGKCDRPGYTWIFIYLVISAKGQRSDAETQPSGRRLRYRFFPASTMTATGARPGRGSPQSRRYSCGRGCPGKPTPGRRKRSRVRALAGEIKVLVGFGVRVCAGTPPTGVQLTKTTAIRVLILSATSNVILPKISPTFDVFRIQYERIG
jgi:hypothetical protein